MRNLKTYFVICGVAALVILFALWVKRERSRSAYYSCISVLKMIDGAKEQWALELKKTTNDVPRVEDLVGTDRYTHEIPKCPEGGTYTIGRIGQDPTCSIGGPVHSLPAE